MEPWYVHVRILPMYDVWYSGCSSGNDSYSKSTTRKKLQSVFFASAAIAAFVCGVTEPFEFGFMFLAPGLYVVYALLYGIFTVITVCTWIQSWIQSFSAGAN